MTPELRERTLRLLREIERGGEHGSCPRCGGFCRRDGPAGDVWDVCHVEDCELAAVIRELSQGEQDQ